jgi:hypothetical protein
MGDLIAVGVVVLEHMQALIDGEKIVKGVFSHLVSCPND